MIDCFVIAVIIAMGMGIIFAIGVGLLGITGEIEEKESIELAIDDTVADDSQSTRPDERAGPGGLAALGFLMVIVVGGCMALLFWPSDRPSDMSDRKGTSFMPTHDADKKRGGTLPKKLTTPRQAVIDELSKHPEFGNGTYAKDRRARTVCIIGEVGRYNNKVKSAKTIYSRMGYRVSTACNDGNFIITKNGVHVLVDSGRVSVADTDSIRQTKSDMNRFSTDLGVFICDIFHDSVEPVKMFAGANGILLINNNEFLNLASKYMRPEIDAMFGKK